MNHTPGPWRVTRHGFEMIKVESKDRVIFDGFRGEEANANLAAAAPELLEALDGVLVEATRIGRGDVVDPGLVVEMIRQKAAQAIAKATGQ